MLRSVSVDSLELWDVIIVGGGPAGLSAAMLLGRCRRKVLVLDDGRPRNRVSRAAHGVFTRDGEDPMTILQIARDQLAHYAVEVRVATVERIVRRPDRGFELAAEGGERFACRKLLLATGVVDELPPIRGFDEIYGTSAFHCPYCDGWEFRDRRLAVLASGSAGVEYALGITTWSRDVVLCTNGRHRLTRQDRLKLEAHGVLWCAVPIVALEHDAGQLAAIVFEDQRRLARDALFFQGRTRQRCDLARQLGCALTRDDKVKSNELASTGAGVYVAGDSAREVHFVPVAAAEGVKAAFAINRELREEHSRAVVHAYLAAGRTSEVDGQLRAGQVRE